MHAFPLFSSLFLLAFLNIHQSGVLTPLVVATGLMPREAAAVSALVLCIPFNHAPDYCQCHFISSHIRAVHVRLVVTCHMHFWQNDRELLRATAVTQAVERIPKLETTQKVDPGEEFFSGRSCCRTQICDLSIMSPELYY